MDDRSEREVIARLDYIERHLVNLGQVSDYRYVPFAQLQAGGQSSFGSSRAPGEGFGSFGAAPASFGPLAFAEPVPSPGSTRAPLVDQSSAPAFGGGAVPADVVAMAQSGQVIRAIKLYRGQTGVSLKEAKAAVEQAAAGYFG